MIEYTIGDPTYGIEDIVKKEVAALDKTQKAAVLSTAKNVAIKASAGSGKTKTLISAILAYRYEYINAKICAITFTRAARKEMEERLENCGIRNVDVTTIHVWSRNLLSKLEEKYNFKVHILTDAEIKDILSMLVSFYNREKPRNRRIAINIGVLFS